MTTGDRLDLLAAAAPAFAPWTGPFSRPDLDTWIASEFGAADALEAPLARGPVVSVVRPPGRLLHILSGNTPHAAMQSLLRGLVLGSHNTLKLPSEGLPDLDDTLAALPAPLRAMVSVEKDLPPGWTDAFDHVVVFGDDETIRWFRRHAPPHLPLTLHGQRLSIALILGDAAGAAPLAARDISRFDQRGCLSVHAVYVAPECGTDPVRVAAELAEAMDAYDRRDPRRDLTPSEAGAISTTRETARFVAASRPHDCRLWESTGTSHWTVIFERDPVLRASCLNRLVYVKPWPREDPATALGPGCRHLSTIALHPPPPAADPPAELMNLGATRLCALGETQDPPIFWHHDGLPPLASLVTWIDLG